MLGVLRSKAGFLRRLTSLSVPLRHRSSKAAAAGGHVVEVDMAEYDVALKHFDDLIQRILVKKNTPDWLPFVPGSSFWVPPRLSPSNVADLVHKLSYEDHRHPHDCSPLLSTLRGWPSDNFFIDENESTDGEDTDIEINGPDGTNGTVKVKVLTFSENVAHSEDEEG
ncbi:hypothetical protein AAZX31_09G057300 [Glycine max]|uniref:Uncharacterized protein n=2 Tax=Glycine subgen. Soja TaxID=1462606 RepID=I1L1D7_SOYBN|nr:uncharacterized protein LOC100815849 [Glycine max]XP_025979462.1 uncharacterized protein LOC100815849 [Glycine max]XP_028181702.1 uncharacterized protein LOC114368674 [Glycine soja]KAG4990646.1 hypothetical protein JHK87_024103 [Glycine soja]KAG5006165.1 hypothetical protein JHK85_024707 [Glycine max]KAG5011968.1 hypothetical protein JHK86_024229 [Glycine max]KAG5132955.1 hypothetical protein JHK82_024143 [Glycine max]KAH1041693.1 hypothetical protein GYH30_024178 [Glycine max]|eukprot:XP_003533736.1 uncharacterized protein LOC100815849 [Glycine max]